MDFKPRPTRKKVQAGYKTLYIRDELAEKLISSLPKMTRALIILLSAFLKISLMNLKRVNERKLTVDFNGKLVYNISR